MTAPGRKAARRLWLAVALGLVLSACAPDVGEPAGAYRRFADAVRQGDDNTAWNLLSENTRSALDDDARRISEATGRDKPMTGRQLAFSQPLVLQQRIARIETVEQSSDRARITVIDDAGGRTDVALVREQGGWRIDLSDALASR